MKASVLPLPVCATEITSKQPIAMGTEWPCTGVGTANPANLRLRPSTRPQLSPANSLHGATSGGSSRMLLGSSTSTGMSAYFENSIPELLGSPNSRR